ncbi:glucose/sorbosone family PQQ-dependent dehydrogenase [Erwinia sp. HR93]|uniref:glucose/sorbosone family PQQ-dependent dehydrogenase n=1 Tax=Erwinia sp. HR93 TaxID=3094840 RepID=UPI002ADECAC7|nr:glucose/sorbosone family PQQ-dependent dehydrogenase [Erwinia sp. HR93]MEA1063956.1 glucose/sorbosone family PQQ-dependent dehydrogenase [Erwinia sp. HR93]
MKKIKLSALSLAITLVPGVALSAHAAESKAQPVSVTTPFKSSVLTTDLAYPWDMVWGPDNYIWVTERQGKRITRIDPATGKKQVAATLDAVHIGPQHEGLLGLALSPTFMQKEGDNYVYAAYTYMEGEQEHAKIVRLEYSPDTHKLSNETTVLAGFPAGSDHNGGRLRFGPDGKLYYSIGEQGHNQGAHWCEEIQAQRTPTQDELGKKDYSSYAGKVLRLNTDGSIPDDNPTIEGVKSHVFTYGHRNPQGLVFVGKNLYSTEQGPSSDDELNKLEAGGNYGWPHVAGFRDDQGYAYANYSKAANCKALTYDANYIPDGVPVQKETDWNAPNFKAPLKTFYTVRSGYNFRDAQCDKLSYLCWPTIAPSSVGYYPADGVIKEWRNSLLITSLKNGALYRVPLNADRQGVQGDEAKYFRSVNRYRSVLVSPDTKKIFIATDPGGNALTLENTPAKQLSNQGQILVFEYTGK